MEHFAITLNRSVQCHPHKDKNNIGTTAILFIGDFEGGDLVLADGRQFSRRREWFRYDGAQTEHWNTPITSGEKIAVVAHNTHTKPEAFPYRKGSMLRQKVHPLTKEHLNKKRSDYKSIVEQVRNEGQEFSATGRTDLPARLEKQAVQVPKPPRGRHN